MTMPAKKSKKSKILVNVTTGIIITTVSAIILYFILPRQSPEKALPDLRKGDVASDTSKAKLVNLITTNQQGDNNTNAAVLGNQNTVIQGNDNKTGNNERTVIENNYYNVNNRDTSGNNNGTLQKIVNPGDNKRTTDQVAFKGRVLTEEDKSSLDELEPSNNKFVRIFRKYFDGESIQYATQIQDYLKKKGFKRALILATRENYYSLTERFLVKYADTGKGYDIYIYSLTE